MKCGLRPSIAAIHEPKVRMPSAKCRLEGYKCLSSGQWSTGTVLSPTRCNEAFKNHVRPAARLTAKRRRENKEAANKNAAKAKLLSLLFGQDQSNLRRAEVKGETP